VFSGWTANTVHQRSSGLDEFWSKNAILSLRPGKYNRGFRLYPDLSGVARENPKLESRRSYQTRNHQLPDFQAGARWPLLRTDLRTRHRLGMSLRQVQADEAPRRHLRQVRRRSHAR